MKMIYGGWRLPGHTPGCCKIDAWLGGKRYRFSRAARCDLWIGVDISDLHAETREDPLTGALNRRAFDTDSEKAGQLGLVIIDVDRFKAINDSLGHPAGDKVLMGVQHAIRGAIREVDSCYRIGGEEFAVIVRDVSPEDVRDVCDRVLSAVRALGVTVSAGWTHTCSEPVSALYCDADRLCYHSKRLGGDRASGPSLHLAHGELPNQPGHRGVEANDVER